MVRGRQVGVVPQGNDIGRPPACKGGISSQWRTTFQYSPYGSHAYKEGGWRRLYSFARDKSRKARRPSFCAADKRCSYRTMRSAANGWNIAFSSKANHNTESSGIYMSMPLRRKSIRIAPFWPWAYSKSSLESKGSCGYVRKKSWPFLREKIAQKNSQ